MKALARRLGLWIRTLRRPALWRDLRAQAGLILDTHHRLQELDESPARRGPGLTAEEIAGIIEEEALPLAEEGLASETAFAEVFGTGDRSQA